MFVRLTGPETGKGAAGKWTDSATGEHGDLLDVIRESCGLIDFKDIADGLSKTIMVVETKEENWAGWYEATTAWVVALDPNATVPTRGVSPAPPYLLASTAAGSGNTALNLGPKPDASKHYLLGGTGAGVNAVPGPWEWGPSSEHSGGVVLHLVGDGAVKELTEDMNANTYMWLVTRNGREPADIEK